jgi:hypothetical protein
MKGLRPISTIRLFTAEAFTQAQAKESVAVDLREIDQSHVFAISYVEAGAGTLKLEYLAGPTQDGPFVEPTAASDIVAATSGTNNVAFSPILTPWMKIKATENNAGTITSFDLWLHVQ